MKSGTTLAFGWGYMGVQLTPQCRTTLLVATKIMGSTMIPWEQRGENLSMTQFNAHFKNWIGFGQSDQGSKWKLHGRIYASDQSLVANRDYAIRINSNRSRINLN